MLLFGGAHVFQSTWKNTWDTFPKGTNLYRPFSSCIRCGEQHWSKISWIYIFRHSVLSNMFIYSWGVPHFEAYLTQPYDEQEFHFHVQYYLFIPKTFESLTIRRGRYFKPLFTFNTRFCWAICFLPFQEGYNAWRKISSAVWSLSFDIPKHLSVWFNVCTSTYICSLINDDVSKSTTHLP